MVGPDVAAIGGMGSVARALAESPSLAERADIELLDSGGGHGRAGWIRYPSALAVAMRGRCDLMHLHVASRGSTWRKMSFAALARARQRPYVVHLHGARYVEFLDSLHGPQLTAVRAFYGGAARVITLGDGWRDVVLERLGTDPARTLVVANGVPQVSASTPQSTIVHLGEVTRRKGADVLLSAAADVLGDRREWRVELVGPTPEADLLGSVADLAKDLDGRVAAVGPRYGRDRLPFLGGAGIFVLASRNEGLPMAMLEAMSAGVPVVVSPVGAIGEVISDGVNGRLVPVGDVPALATVLAELMDDPDQRSRLGAAGAATWRERFSAEQMADGVARAWQDTLRERA